MPNKPYQINAKWSTDVQSTQSNCWIYVTITHQIELIQIAIENKIKSTPNRFFHSVSVFTLLFFQLTSITIEDVTKVRL